jgi:hypothetical protein
MPVEKSLIFLGIEPNDSDTDVVVGSAETLAHQSREAFFVLGKGDVWFEVFDGNRGVGRESAGIDQRKVVQLSEDVQRQAVSDHAIDQ